MNDKGNLKKYIVLCNKIYNLSNIIIDYCKFNEGVDEVQNILTAVSCLHDFSDKLMSELEKDYDCDI